MDHRKHFYERYTQAQSRFTSEAQIQDRLHAEQRILGPLLHQYLPSSHAARILDLGCGYGANLLSLKDKGYSNLRGVDISPEQVALAHTLGADMVELGSIEAALSEERNVQLVTMLDVFEHLTRSEALSVLQRIYDCLAPDGLLVMRTPNVDAPLGSVLSFGDLTHEMHLNKYAVLEMFGSLMYTHVEVLPVNPLGGSPAVQLARIITKPFMWLHNTLSHIDQGISRSATINTPNMLIVARKSGGKTS
ncbi:MAG: class I SAM-dependent methyltransferase [Ignavibacteria bacterium]|nr:class I SAM-dependent methyltransferase [Ignavibacteria bacterium]